MLLTQQFINASAPLIKAMEILLSRIINRCAIPQKCTFVSFFLFVSEQGNKELPILFSQLALHVKSEVTALPPPAHTVDSWTLQTCVWIKAKVFMMDAITDNETVMGWKYGRNIQMGEMTQMVSPMEQSEAALV